MNEFKNIVDKLDYKQGIKNTCIPFIESQFRALQPLFSYINKPFPQDLELCLLDYNIWKNIKIGTLIFNVKSNGTIVFDNYEWTRIQNNI